MVHRAHCRLALRANDRDAVLIAQSAWGGSSPQGFTLHPFLMDHWRFFFFISYWIGKIAHIWLSHNLLLAASLHSMASHNAVIRLDPLTMDGLEGLDPGCSNRYATVTLEREGEGEGLGLGDRVVTRCFVPSGHETTQGDAYENSRPSGETWGLTARGLSGH